MLCSYHLCCVPWSLSGAETLLWHPRASTSLLPSPFQPVMTRTHNTRRWVSIYGKVAKLWRQSMAHTMHTREMMENHSSVMKSCDTDFLDNPIEFVHWTYRKRGRNDHIPLVSSTKIIRQKSEWVDQAQWSTWCDEIVNGFDQMILKLPSFSNVREFILTCISSKCQDDIMTVQFQCLHHESFLTRLEIKEALQVNIKSRNWNSHLGQTDLIPSKIKAFKTEFRNRTQRIVRRGSTTTAVLKALFSHTSVGRFFTNRGLLGS